VDGGEMVTTGKLAEIIKMESISMFSGSSATVGESGWLDKVASDE